MIRAGWAAALAAAALMTVGSAPAHAQQLEQEPAATTTRLSVFGGVSRWAHPARRAIIRAEPRLDGRHVGRLRLLTEDDFPEAYLLVERRRAFDSEYDWVQIRIPGRPNGRKGWVPRDALGGFRRVTTSVVVNRAKRRVVVRRGSRIIATFRVGVGKRSTPTPAGEFWIREKFRVADPGGLYGPLALGTAAYAPRLTDWPNGGVVGFHGTDQPGLIPGNPSNGCIRLRNPDIRRFYRLVPVGTPVRII